MELQDFLQDGQSDTSSVRVNDDGLLRDDPDSDEEGASDGFEEEAPSGEADSGLIGGRFSSQEELLKAYLDLERRFMERQTVPDNVDRRLARLEQKAQFQRNLVDDVEFQHQLKQAYENNPLETIQMMILQSKHEHMQAMESMIQQAFQNLGSQRQYGNEISGLLDSAGYTNLKPYSAQLEFLVRNGNMDPEVAITLVQSIAERQEQISGKRSAAARRIRNRSTMESAGEPGDTADSNGQFDKVLKNSRTLEEMFHGLRKIKL